MGSETTVTATATTIGVQAGAQAFRGVINAIGAMTAAAYERHYPERDRGDDDPDPRDYHAFGEFIVGEFRTAFDSTDSDYREGFVRCMASLFSIVADGCCPGSDWDPLKETAESFAQAAAREDDEAERVFQAVLTSEPSITDEMVDTIETTAQAQEFSGRPRRLGLLIASKPGAWFKELSEDEELAAAIVEALPCLREHIARIRSLADLLGVAYTRATVAMCAHPGFDPRTLKFQPSK